ncbi:MAG TPA: sugar phosphate nucleotidyltransferase [Methylibium sp.]|uniref:sugar phosphate nucleotidyltransferase n=1 Tax=Methylibium sp. TaxID=2067992 RepID=UPI002DB5D64B|nr:sugar phosphate nucleotidyltransferase [Methylibium sp.]HEU4460834.1 sugar phosphate nucleotidyltransferase [Methylibium sp.]
MDARGGGEVARSWAFVMAGGAGSRLAPLTAERCKPALPFGGRHRVVDFAISNLLNAGLPSLDLLVQHRPEALLRHVERAWPARPALGAPVQVLAATLDRPYRGTADAVRQHLARVRASGARQVAIFGADHIYRMDVAAMLEAHAASGADVTIAVLPVPLREASGFGVVEVDAARRILAFHEKPARPEPAADHPGHALASMGNYVFSTEVLCDALARAQAEGGTDFGHDVLPALLAGGHRLMAYDFQHSPAPGACAEPRRYWRDIGTLDAYFAAHMDTLGAEAPFALDDALWPIGALQPPARARIDAHAEVTDCRLGDGAIVECALLDRTVAGDSVRIGRHAQLDHAVLMDGVRVGAGARLQRVIVDEGNAIPGGEVIGFDARRDRARFPVSAGGIVVVPRGHFAGESQPAAQAFGPGRHAWA